MNTGHLMFLYFCDLAGRACALHQTLKDALDEAERACSRNRIPILTRALEEAAESLRHAREGIGRWQP